MNRKRMNEMPVAKITPFPGFEVLAEEAKERRPSWIVRAGIAIGVLMANPESPRGWSANPAFWTLVLTIIGMVAFGGYYMGQKDAESRQILERLAAAEAKAEKAVQLEAARSGQVGHEEPTPKKEKK